MNTHNRFEDAFSLSAVTASFESLESNHRDLLTGKVRIPPGADRITYEEFARDRAKHLAAVSRKALDGRYTFAPLLELEKEKEGSVEPRIISVCSIRDAIVQRSLSNYLYPIIDEKLTDSVFGYRKGRSAHQAVSKIVSYVRNGKKAIFDADFSKFFDSVDHDILIGKLKSLDLDQRALKLLYRWLKSARVTVADREEHQTLERDSRKQIKYKTSPRVCGVPQGGILSGLISNLYLAEFDLVLRSKEIAYVRYADDFVVCCDKKSDCEEIRRIAETQANELQIKLHPDKTWTYRCADDGFNFLGFFITDKMISVRAKNMAKFKNRIMKVIETQKNRSTVEQTLKRLCFRLNYKISGPKKEVIKILIETGKANHPYRRCWVGFFRIVTNERQIWKLDRWIRKQISGYFWRKYRRRIRYSEMRSSGLMSLLGIMYKSRKPYMEKKIISPT